MAMTSNLSAAQKLSLYEILGLPYATTFTVMSGYGEADTDNLGNPLNSDTYSTIKTQVDAFLASIGSDPAGTTSAIETKIIALITEWDAIRLKTTSVVTGSVGSAVNGVTYDPEARRRQVQMLMETYVPYIAKWRLEIRRAGSQSGVGMVRMAK
jgi:hypothetical protein